MPTGCTEEQVAMKFYCENFFCRKKKVKVIFDPPDQKEKTNCTSEIRNGFCSYSYGHSHCNQLCRLDWICIRVLLVCLFLTIISALLDTESKTKLMYDAKHPNAFPVMPPNLKDVLPLVTFAIKSGGRRDKVVYLIRSLKYYYPSGHTILVVDDGKDKLILPNKLRNGVEIIQLPVDSGLASGRNELIRHTKTKYMMYFDDDFWLEDDSQVHKMVQYMIKHPNIDIVGGIVMDRPDYIGFDFDIAEKESIDGNTHRILYQRKIHSKVKGEGGCTKVDIVPNFFTAITSSLRKVEWDSHFKLGEHEDFFLRAKLDIGLNIETCHDMSKIHHAPNTDWYYSTTEKMKGYAKRRRRAFQYMQDFLNKHNIHLYQTDTDVLLAANENMQTIKSIQHANEVRLNEDRPKVTAVLMNWKRKHNVVKIISSLSTLDYIDDIVVYQNNINDPLTMKYLMKSNHWSNHLLSLVNLIPADKEAGNLNTASRFVACNNFAVNDVCMFIDDDFWPSTFNSLYAQWLNDRDRVHALANFPQYWNDLRWTFVGTIDSISNDSTGGGEKKTVSIHTGFTWLGVGSIVKKSLVTHFLKHQLPLIKRPDLADNYFSILSNRIPSVLITPLYTNNLDQSSAYSSTKTIIDALDEARKEAISLVRSGKVTFLPPSTPKSELNPFEIEMKAATSTRSYDSRAKGWYPSKRTFITNVVLNSVKSSSIDQYSNIDLWTYIHNPTESVSYMREEAEGDHAIGTKYYDKKITDEHKTLWEYPPTNAIDQDDLDNYDCRGQNPFSPCYNYGTYAADSYQLSCWKSTRNIYKDDWFGLDLGKVMHSLNILVLKSLVSVREMRLEISSDGNKWIPFTLMHKVKDSKCEGNYRILDHEDLKCREMRYDLTRVSNRVAGLQDLCLQLFYNNFPTPFLGKLIN
jgi:GT2 family glycosyltransferase